MKKEEVVRISKAWVEAFVIGLNLCPFAKAPAVKGRIRYCFSDATSPETLHQELLQELLYLVETPLEKVETSLIIHPNVLQGFREYLDFLDWSQALLEQSELEGIIQIASFHPDYQFAGTQITDVENYTNRSPYPMLHLIREDSISKALEAYEDPDGIPERNIEKMKTLGLEKIKGMLEALKQAK